MVLVNSISITSNKSLLPKFALLNRIPISPLFSQRSLITYFQVDKTLQYIEKQAKRPSWKNSQTQKETNGGTTFT